MAMDAADFHKTAELLKNKEEEWHIRTSISRSYYGLFLYLREFLKSSSVTLPDRRQKSHHQFIAECFYESRFFEDTTRKNDKGSKKVSRSKDKTILGIHTRLRSLLQRRTDADYGLHLKFRQNDSVDSFDLATATIQEFQELRGTDRENHIVETAKKHARSIRSR